MSDITHDDLCYLSRLFNDNENCHSDRYRRINDWLKKEIEKRNTEFQDRLNIINAVNAGVVS